MTARDPGYLTIPELAARWGVAPHVVYTMRYRRKGPGGFRVGRQVMFTLDEVREWEREQACADRARIR